MSRKTLAVPMTVVGLAALGFAGCGGGNDSKPAAPAPSKPAAPSGGGGGATGLKLKADPGGKFAFDKTALSAKAGKVTIDLTNPAALAHDIAIEGNGVDVKSDLADQGQTVNVTTDLKPGKYAFYCSVPGHRDGGMEGTLTVE